MKTAVRCRWNRTWAFVFVFALALNPIRALRCAAEATQGSIVVWNEAGRAPGEPAGDDFVAVAAGFDHSLALRADGSLVGWGGIGPDLQGLPSGNDFVAIAAGDYHALALKSDGSIAAWGSGTDVAVPPPGVPNEGFIAIAAGGYHNLALRTDGSIVAWGSGTDVAVPPPGVENSGFVAIAASEYHNLALREDGTVVAWGDPIVGEVSDTPTDGGFVDVAAGFGRSMALRLDGSIVYWGAEDGTTSPTRSYYRIAGGNFLGLGLYGEGRIGTIWVDVVDYGTPDTDGFIAIASGYRHAVAIKGVASDLAITSPTSGATVGAGNSLEIEAAFSVETPDVTRVEFLAGATILGDASEAPYSFSWFEVPPGTHLLTARAVLGDGSSITSAPVSITAYPVPVITSPARKDVFFVGAAVLIDAELTEDVIAAERIEFYANAVKKAEAVDRPYSFLLDAPVGDYSLIVRAVYPGGETIDSDPVAISIVERPRITSPLMDQRLLTDDPVSIEVDVPVRSAGVERVTFFDGTTEIGAATQAPYSLIWPISLRDDAGRRVLRIQVRYADRISVISEPVFVDVIADSEPTIAFPYDGAPFMLGEPIPIEVIPSAVPEDIDFMNLVVDSDSGGTAAHAVMESPYRYEWKGAPEGSYKLTAIEVRKGGGELASAGVWFYVQSTESCFLNYLASAVANSDIPATRAVGGSPLRHLLAQTSGIDLDLLRRLRDEVLNTTAAGRYFADLYQRMSPGIIEAVVDDPSLIVSMSDVLTAWTPAIQAMVDDNAASVVITSDMVTALLEILPRVRSVADKDLRDQLQAEVEALDPESWTDMIAADLLDRMESQTRPAPRITTWAAAQAATAGSAATLSIAADGAGPLSYQWYRDGVAIDGATNSAFTFSSVQQSHAGEYTVLVANPFGETVSNALDFTVDPPPANDARLLNLSTRGLAQSGDKVLIPGFVIGGNGSKKLLIRAVGPTLGQAPFNLGGTLPDPGMVLKKLDTSTGVYVDLADNDDWQTNGNVSEISLTAATLGAFPLVEAKDAALLVDLAPGQYSVVAGDKVGASGIGIVELYDADGSSSDATFVNISNRGFCGVGNEVMIPGFVISDEGPKTLLVRVVGPTLEEFGVSGAMADPKLTVYSGSTPILENDDWAENPDAANTVLVAQQVGAFPLADGSKDAAFVITLTPGAYTVVGSAADAATGIVLVEVYVVP